MGNPEWLAIVHATSAFSCDHVFHLQLSVNAASAIAKHSDIIQCDFSTATSWEQWKLINLQEKGKLSRNLTVAWREVSLNSIFRANWHEGNMIGAVAWVGAVRLDNLPAMRPSDLRVLAINENWNWIGHKLLRVRLIELREDSPKKNATTKLAAIMFHRTSFLKS